MPTSAPVRDVRTIKVAHMLGADAQVMLFEGTHWQLDTDGATVLTVLNEKDVVATIPYPLYVCFMDEPMKASNSVYREGYRKGYMDADNGIEPEIDIP